MQTHVSALTPKSLMPAPATQGPNGELRTFTVGVPVTIEFTDTVEGVAVAGELHLAPNFRYELVRLELQADSIGPDDLRGVPVRRLIVQAARRHAEGVIVESGGRMTTKAFNRHELTDDELVAGLWWLAQACRDNPNPLIATELGITVAAATQRVSRLRRAGIIPPAEKRGGRY
jgi:hypothetical protein